MKKGISIKLCLGYGTGALGEAGFYQFVTSFQLIFLTGVVGISPELAGTITSLTILVDAVCSIAVGRFSDHLAWRFGRRRPFVLLSIFSMPVTVILSFTTIHQSQAVMFAYYTVMGALCWIAYSVFYIPYTALGAEIATDYDDRIRLRSVARVFTIAATFFGTAMPLWVIDYFMNKGKSQAQGWFYFVLMFGLLVAAGLFACWYTTRGTEPVPETCRERQPLWHVFFDFYQLLRIKSMAILMGAKVIFMIAFTLYTSGMMFFLQYKVGLSGQAISSVYVVSVVVSAVYTPVISYLALRLGKQQQVIMAIAISGTGGLGLYAAGVDSYWSTLLYAALFMYVQSSYWQISNAIFYDITEADEYRYGKRREGSITALQSIAGTLSASIGLQLIGILLKGAGFDSSLPVQNEQALEELARIFILYPSIALLISGALLYTYPITRRRFLRLQMAIDLKKRGEDYSMYREELDRLL